MKAFLQAGSNGRIPRPARSGPSGVATGKSLGVIARTLWPVGAVVAALLIAPRNREAQVFIGALLAVNLLLVASVPDPDAQQKDKAAFDR